MAKEKHPDGDRGKRAVEEAISTPSQGVPNLSGQQGHRDEDEMIKNSDSDFPEPGSNPEHSGEGR